MKIVLPLVLSVVFVAAEPRLRSAVEAPASASFDVSSFPATFQNLMGSIGKRFSGAAADSKVGALPDVSSLHRTLVEQLAKLLPEGTQVGALPDLSTLQSTLMEQLTNILPEGTQGGVGALPDISTLMEQLTKLLPEGAHAGALPDISTLQSTLMEQLTNILPQGTQGGVGALPDISTLPNTLMEQFSKMLPEGLAHGEAGALPDISKLPNMLFEQLTNFLPEGSRESLQKSLQQLGVQVPEEAHIEQASENGNAQGVLEAALQAIALPFGIFRDSPAAPQQESS